MKNKEEKIIEGLTPTQWPKHSDEKIAKTSVFALLGWNQEKCREEILLMKRSQSVGTHRGQISFPGGYFEPGDRDLLNTALREVREEIGVEERDIRVLGKLQPVATRGRVLIYPWVGRMEFPYPFHLNPGEVDSLLFLSTAELLREELKTMEIDISGFKVKSPGIIVEKEMVWGATAKMLLELREVLLKAWEPPDLSGL